ncbi:MAG: hypothetical protein AAGL89_00715 [Pseudomonadota bacterium]
MRAVVLVAAFALSACMPQPTAEQQAARAEALVNASMAPSVDRVMVASETYVVTVSANGARAVVTPISVGQHNLDRIETAAFERTGCTAVADRQYYDAMRGNRIVQIPSSRLRGAFAGTVEVTLTC